MTETILSDVELKPVIFSNIRAMGYDSALGQSHVVFNSGEHWVYIGVPAELHAEMIKASSIRSFFHQRIRGKFKGEKVQKTEGKKS